MTRKKENSESYLMLKTTLDLNGDGISSLWRPYQLETIRILFDGEPVTTGKVWKKLNDIEGIKISRASVIIWLRTLANLGVIAESEATGKGGHHRIYEMMMSTIEFENFWIMKALKALFKCFPANKYLKNVISEGLPDDR